MLSKQYLSLSIIVFALLLTACTTLTGQRQAKGDISPCQLVYDAGSSGTRLYIYELTSAGWLQHRGPRTGALADPVRGVRGKTMADAGIVVGDIVTALENMRHDGPLDSKGERTWPAFDWRKECNIETAAVYATAGMRLAEQHDAEASKLLWKLLNDSLSSVLGMKVTTRTLTGNEEGLFAWLAIREGLGNEYFGVAEMGGASVQVTFPCTECVATRQIRAKGRIVRLYSNSILDWGQDEAWKKYGHLPACARGAGKENPDWKITDCATGMDISSDIAVDIQQYVRTTDTSQWYLTGAFRHMQDTDIEHFCRMGIKSEFEPATSCFRAIYLQKVLTALGLPAIAEPGAADWTLGAVVCTATRCLDGQ